MRYVDVEMEEAGKFEGELCLMLRLGPRPGQPTVPRVGNLITTILKVDLQLRKQSYTTE